VLVDDRVGAVAVPALGALVELDDKARIIPALTARNAGLRRAARDWASIRDIDARGIYLQRLESDLGDGIALIALAELGDEDDGDLFLGMLQDRRCRIRAAGLRALAKVNRPIGRREALRVLSGPLDGRLTWTAINVLRGGTLSHEEINVISGIVLEAARPASQRLQALSILRPLRWEHLAVMLEAKNGAEGDDIAGRLDTEIESWIRLSGRTSRGPNPEQRSRIDGLLPTLSDKQRREIEFILRTSD
jgi:hypothetical protein